MGRARRMSVTGGSLAGEYPGRHRVANDMRAILNGTVIAESNDTVVVEGNHYFPAS